MKNTLIYSIILFIAAVLFVACEDKTESLNFSSDVDIYSFVINEVEGTINPENSTITLVLPNGTDLTALTPQITLGEGAEITPANGLSIDFSNSAIKGSEVIYTVTNNNLYQKYKVSVDVSKAKITGFRIGTNEGSIDEVAKTITVYVPDATDVTSLIPIIEYTEGASITPETGMPVDFTNPVEYKLNYFGSDFIYTVTVHLGEPPVSPVVIYNGEDVAPAWEGIAATAESPFANPKKDGINSSSYCASILRLGSDSDDGGKPWSGAALWNSYKVNIDPAIYDSFSLMVLKEVAGDVQIEIQSDGEQDKDWLKVWYSEDDLGEWQKLTFKIPEGRTAMINSILVAPHCHDAGQPVAFDTQRMYWDELIALPKEK